jgi:phosphoribosylformylglycinamidine cyclo-ligase
MPENKTPKNKTPKNKSQNAYKSAGVDIDAGNELVERIKPHVAKTKRSGVMGGIGGFGACFDLKETGYRDPLLVAATDGVGTKLKIAIETDHHDTVGIDLVAMCANDLIVQGAEPLFFLDYFATSKLEPESAARIVGGIADGCALAGCALIGGETAEMPGMYASKDYDLAGFCVGAVERTRVITGDRIKSGDIVLGLASGGLHSNGFSLVRKIMDETVLNQGGSYDAPAVFDPEISYAAALLSPTRLYIKSLLPVLQQSAPSGYPLIKGMAHITGGGILENIPRALPDGLKVELDGASWTMKPVFHWLREQGAIGDTDMLTTFNCGIGMVVIAAPEHAQNVKEQLSATGETVFEMGTVQPCDNDNDERVHIKNLGSLWMADTKS